jgi:hypothetical protein
LLQGAGELRQVPPLLYLDEPALAPVPRALLAEAVCEVRELNSGGMLIRTRAEPLDPPTEAEEAAAERVGDALGL